MVELADAPDSKSGEGNLVWVRLPPPAPGRKKRRNNLQINKQIKLLYEPLSSALPKKRLKAMVFFNTALIILCLSTTLFATTPSPWDIEGLIGKKAPDFTLKDIYDRSFNLSSLRGKVVIINFWATWCPPCRAEMPSLNNLYKEFRNKGLEVIAISTDRSVQPVKDYLSKNHLDITVLIDTENRVSRQFKVFSIPTTFLIDRNGIIIERYLGEENWTSPEIKKKIKDTLIGIP